MHFFETSFHALVNFTPYLLLAVYPFRDRFRYSKTLTYLILIAVNVGEIIFEYLTLEYFNAYADFLSICNTVFFFILFFLLVKDKWGKLLFTLLMISNCANFILVASTYLSHVIFHMNTDDMVHWTTSLSMLVIEIIILLPVFWYFKKHYTPAIHASEEAAWYYLWMIPVIFYGLWFYVLYMTIGYSSYEMALRPGTTIFLFLTTLGSWIIYHIIVILIRTQNALMLQQRKAHVLEIQSLQYHDLTKQMEASRIARHDLRHHITLIDHYLMQGQLDELHDYLASYEKSLALDHQILFCKNRTVNLIVSFFAQQADYYQILFNVRANLPEKLKMEELDLSILLGNLIENAIDECKRPELKDPVIDLAINTQGEILYLTLQNSSVSIPAKKDSQTFYSQKAGGSGLGLVSARQIVEKYNGTLQTSYDEHHFSVSLILYM